MGSASQIALIFKTNPCPLVLRMIATVVLITLQAWFSNCRFVSAKRLVMMITEVRT